MLALAQGAPMVPSNALLDRKYHCMGPEPAQVEVSSSVSIESASLPCLPRRTVVLVTGNNRTKKTLIGQQAVVKRAVGLGGWHHCVLQDGSEVKLQRNALSVLEMGPPEAIDDSPCSSADTDAREPKIDVLTQPRIRRPSRALFPAHDVATAVRRPELISSNGLYGAPPSSGVDLHKLEPTSLKRYRRVFRLGEVDAEAPQAHLATAVQQHFTTQEVDEVEVLYDLVCALRRRYKRQQLSPVQPYSTLDLSRSLSAHSSQCLFDQLQQHQQQQQQQGEQEGEGNDGDGGDTAAAAGVGEASSDDQLRQLILLQQQYVYLGPKLFQDPAAQQQQQQAPADAAIAPADAAIAPADAAIAPADVAAPTAAPAPAPAAAPAAAAQEQQQLEVPAAAPAASGQLETAPAVAAMATDAAAAAPAAPTTQQQPQQQPAPVAPAPAAVTEQQQ